MTVVEIYILAAALPLHPMPQMYELLLIGKNIWLYALSSLYSLCTAAAEVNNLLRILSWEKESFFQTFKNYHIIVLR